MLELIRKGPDLLLIWGDALGEDVLHGPLDFAVGAYVTLLIVLDLTPEVADLEGIM